MVFVPLSATLLLNNMDSTLDPCEDFYQYSCGNWLRQTVIPENQGLRGTVLDLEDNIRLQIKGMRILSSQWTVSVFVLTDGSPGQQQEDNRILLKTCRTHCLQGD